MDRKEQGKCNNCNFVVPLPRDSLSEVVSELEGSSGKLYEGLVSPEVHLVVVVKAEIW